MTLARNTISACCWRVAGLLFLWASGSSTFAIEPAVFRTAETPQQLFENVRWAIESNAVLRADFYTDQNVKRMFGAGSVSWTDQAELNKFVVIDAKGAGSERSCAKGAVMSWLLKRGDGSPRKAKLQFSVAFDYTDPRCVVLSADLAQKYFGQPVEVKPWLPPGSIHRQFVFQHITHPWGSSDVDYVLESGQISKKAQLVILGGGGIQSISVFMEEM